MHEVKLVAPVIRKNEMEAIKDSDIPVQSSRVALSPVSLGRVLSRMTHQVRRQEAERYRTTLKQILRVDS